MKFKIASDLLKACIVAVDGGIGAMTLGMKSVKIEATKEEVRFFTNSVRIGYSLSVKGSDIDVIEPGVAVVLGATLKKFLLASMSDMMVLSTNEGQLLIKDGNRKTSIGLLHVEDFIDPVLCTEVLCGVDLYQLQAALKAVIYSAASNNTMYDSVYIDGRVIVATDTNKATIVPFVIEDLSSSIILTREAVRELLKQTRSGHVHLMTNGSFVTMYFDSDDQSLTLSFQLLSCNYPDVTAAFKRINAPHIISLSLSRFFEELSYIALISDSKEQICTMQVKDSVLFLNALSEDSINEVSSSLDCWSVSDKDIDFRFAFKVGNMINLSRALIEYIIAYKVETDTMKIKYKDAESPIKIELDGIDIYEMLAALSF